MDISMIAKAVRRLARTSTSVKVVDGESLKHFFLAPEPGFDVKMSGGGGSDSSLLDPWTVYQRANLTATFQSLSHVSPANYIIISKGRPPSPSGRQAFCDTYTNPYSGILHLYICHPDNLMQDGDVCFKHSASSPSHGTAQLHHHHHHHHHHSMCEADDFLVAYTTLLALGSSRHETLNVQIWSMDSKILHVLDVPDEMLPPPFCVFVLAANDTPRSVTVDPVSLRSELLQGGRMTERVRAFRASSAQIISFGQRLYTFFSKHANHHHSSVILCEKRSVDGSSAPRDFGLIIGPTVDQDPLTESEVRSLCAMGHRRPFQTYGDAFGDHFVPFLSLLQPAAKLPAKTSANRRTVKTQELLDMATDSDRSTESSSSSKSDDDNDDAQANVPSDRRQPSRYAEAMQLKQIADALSLKYPMYRTLHAVALSSRRMLPGTLRNMLFTGLAEEASERLQDASYGTDITAALQRLVNMPMTTLAPKAADDQLPRLLGQALAKIEDAIAQAHSSQRDQMNRTQHIQNALAGYASSKKFRDLLKNTSALSRTPVHLQSIIAHVARQTAASGASDDEIKQLFLSLYVGCACLDFLAETAETASRGRESSILHETSALLSREGVGAVETCSRCLKAVETIAQMFPKNNKIARVVRYLNNLFGQQTSALVDMLRMASADEVDLKRPLPAHRSTQHALAKRQAEGKLAQNQMRNVLKEMVTHAFSSMPLPKGMSVDDIMAVIEHDPTLADDVARNLSKRSS